MPRFESPDGEAVNKTGAFAFAHPKANKLGADSYTLVTICLDQSGSVDQWVGLMEQLLKDIVEGCRKHPKADNLMLRVVTFDSNTKELHGFKLLPDINTDDYKASLRAGGSTALYDSVISCCDAMVTYADELSKNDIIANGLMVIITDGENNGSTFQLKDAVASFKKAVNGEKLESLLSVLIELGDSPALTDFYTQIGITQHEKIDKVTDKSFARLANFISQTSGAQSQSLNTGGPSAPITF